MKEELLARHLRQPEIRGRLLPGYEGPYSVGVVKHPTRPGSLAVRVRVPEECHAQPMRQLEVDEEVVDVIVEYTYRPVRPLSRH